jgi:hypothetical protein
LNLLQLSNLLGKDDFRGSSRVDAVSFNGDQEVTSVLQEVLSVDSQNTGLIGLSNVLEDNVDHRDQHSVLLRVSGVLNNGDNVGSLLGNFDKITTATVRQLNGVDSTFLETKKKVRSNPRSWSDSQTLTGPTISAT